MTSLPGPMEALSQEGGYQGAKGSCWVAFVPLEAFPWEENEVVFLVVPSNKEVKENTIDIHEDL